MADSNDTDDRGALDYLPFVLAAAAAVLLLSSLSTAFGIADAARLSGTERFRRLGNAGNPFTALLALGAVLSVVRARRRRVATELGGPAFAIGTTVSLVLALLAANGVVVSATSGAYPGLVRFGEAMQAMTTIGLAGYALWLAITAPTPRESRPAESPPPSPPDGEGPSFRLSGEPPPR